MLTQEYLKSILYYNPETGIWTWLVSKGGVKEGSIAGSLDKENYIRIQINKKHYKAHRLAFLYMINKWPEDKIDHIDNNPSNNKWSNLREATNQQNQFNRGNPKSNTSGYKGVYWDKVNEKWITRIWFNNEGIYLGNYVTLEEAVRIRDEAIKKYHGEFIKIR